MTEKSADDQLQELFDKIKYPPITVDKFGFPIISWPKFTKVGSPLFQRDFDQPVVEGINIVNSEIPVYEFHAEGHFILSKRINNTPVLGIFDNENNPISYLMIEIIDKDNVIILDMFTDDNYKNKNFNAMIIFFLFTRTRVNIHFKKSTDCTPKIYKLFLEMYMNRRLNIIDPTIINYEPDFRSPECKKLSRNKYNKYISRLRKKTFKKFINNNVILSDFIIRGREVGNCTTRYDSRGWLVMCYDENYEIELYED